jgi:transketolase C-terminal domain/subunit
MLACDTMKHAGFDCGIVLIEKLKPVFDFESILKRLVADCEQVVFLEESIKNGGVGMILSERLQCKMKILAIDDVFDTEKATGNAYSDFGIGAFDVIKAFNIKM